MRIQNINALFLKQFKDILKNTPVIILFVVYPVIALIMTQAMKQQEEMGSFFIQIFAVMHCIFTPIVAASMIISEEKEKNTLRVLIMSNVTLKEYLFSIGGFIFMLTLISGMSFLLLKPMNTDELILFIVYMAAGSLISVILGACNGFFSKNTAAASGIAVPSGMFFAFLPMLAYFNKDIEALSRFTYGQQISYVLAGNGIDLFGLSVLLVNLLLLIILATILYRRTVSD